MAERDFEGDVQKKLEKELEAVYSEIEEFEKKFFQEIIKDFREKANRLANLFEKSVRNVLEKRSQFSSSADKNIKSSFSRLNEILNKETKKISFSKKSGAFEGVLKGLKVDVDVFKEKLEKGPLDLPLKTDYSSPDIDDFSIKLDLLKSRVESVARGFELLNNEMSDFYKYVPSVGTFMEKLFNFAFSFSYRFGTETEQRLGQFNKDIVGRVFFDEGEWAKFNNLTMFAALKKTLDKLEKSVVDSTNLSNYERKIFLREMDKRGGILYNRIFSRLISMRQLDISRDITDLIGKTTKDINTLLTTNKNVQQQDIDNVFDKLQKTFTDKIQETFTSTGKDVGETIAKNIGFFGKGTVGLTAGDVVFELLNKRLFKGRLEVLPASGTALADSINDFTDNLNQMMVSQGKIDNFVQTLLKQEREIYAAGTKFGVLNRVLGRFTAGILGLDIKKLTNNFKDMSNLNFSNLLKEILKGVKIVHPFVNVPVVGKETLDYVSKFSRMSLVSLKEISVLSFGRFIAGITNTRKELSNLFAIISGGKSAMLRDLYGGMPIIGKFISKYEKLILGFSFVANFISASFKVLLTFLKPINWALSITVKQITVLTAAIAGLSTVAGVVYGAIYFGLLKPIIESAKVAEQRFVRLASSLQNSIQAVQEYQKSIQFAAKTPFLISQVADAAAMLRAFQFDPFAKVGESGRTLLELLGDMAGAMGTDLETATWALIRAQVGEWEIMQNNFQISSRMIPQLQGLATGTKEYGQAIVEFLDKQKRFVGGLFLMSQSIQGMQSNIKDFFGVILEYATGVVDSQGLLRGVTFVDEYKEFLRGIYYIVTAKDIGTNIQNIKLMSESTSFTIRRLGELFSEQFNRMGRDVLNLYGIMNLFTKSVGSSGGRIPASFQDIRSSLEPMLDEFNKLNEVEKEFFFFGKMLPKIMNEFNTEVKEGTKEYENLRLGLANVLLYGNNLTIVLGRLVGFALSIIMKLFYPVKRLFEYIFLSIRKATLDFLNFITPLEKIMGIAPRLGEDFNRSFNEVAESVVRSMGFAFKITGDQFSRFRQRLLQFNRDYTMSLMDMSKQGSDRLIASMTTLERWIMVIGILTEFIKLYIEDLFNEIWDRTKWLREILWDIYSMIGKFVFDVFKDISFGIFEGLQEAFDVDVYQEFLEAIRDLIKSIIDLFRSGLKIGEQGSLIQKLSKVITKLAVNTLELFLKLMTVFVRFLTWLVEKISPRALEYIANGLISILEVLNWLVEKSSSLVDFIFGTGSKKLEQNKREKFIDVPAGEKQEPEFMLAQTDFSFMPFAKKYSMMFPLIGVYIFKVLAGFFQALVNKIVEFFDVYIIQNLKLAWRFIVSKFDALKNLIVWAIKHPKELGAKLFEFFVFAVKFLVKMLWKGLTAFLNILFKPIKMIANALLKPFKWLYDLITKSKEERQLEKLRRKYEKLCPFADQETLNRICEKNRILTGKGKEKGKDTLGKKTQKEIEISMPEKSKTPETKGPSKIPTKTQTKTPTKIPTKIPTKPTWGSRLGKFSGFLGAGAQLGLMFLPDLVPNLMSFGSKTEETQNQLQSQVKMVDEKKVEEKKSGILEFFKGIFNSFNLIDLFINFGEMIGKFFMGTGRLLLTRFASKGILSWALKILGRSLTFLGGLLAPGAGWALDVVMVVDFLDDIFNLGIKQKLTELLSNLSMEVNLTRLKEIFSKAWGSIKDWWNKMLTFFGFKEEEIKKEKEESKKEAEKLSKEHKEDMKEKKKSFIERTWNYLKSIWDRATDWFSKFFSESKKEEIIDEANKQSMLSKIGTSIKNFLWNIVEKIGNAFSNFWESFKRHLEFFRLIAFEIILSIFENIGVKKETINNLKEFGVRFGLYDITKEQSFQESPSIQAPVRPQKQQTFVERVGTNVRIDNVNLNVYVNQAVPNYSTLANEVFKLVKNELAKELESSINNGRKDGISR